MSPSTSKPSNWPPSLRWSLPLTLLTLALLAVLLQSWLSYVILRRQTDRNHELRLLQQSSHEASLIQGYLADGGEARLMQELTHLVEDHGYTRLSILGEDGRVRASTDDVLLNTKLSDTLSEGDQSSLAMVQSRQTDKRLSKDGAGHLMGFFAIPGKTPNTWTFVAEMNTARSIQLALTVIVRASAAYLIIALSICGTAWWILNRFITRRLSSVLARAKAIAVGLSEGLPLSGNDEFAQIDRALMRTHELISHKEIILRDNETRYRTMLESSPAPKVLLRDGVIHYANAAIAAALGYASSTELAGRDVTELLHPAQRADFADRLQKLQESQATANSMELTLLLPAGGTKAFIGTSAGYQDGAGKAVQLALQDITTLKEAEAQQEKLAQQIAEVAEAEKRRIGQDLHDDICQRLAALKMSMQELEEELAENAPSLLRRADAIVDRLDEAIRTTRGLARGLSPVEIDSGGLAIGLEALCRNSASLLGIRCTVRTDMDVSGLGLVAATQLYRIAQECISNAARHGKARSVHIQLQPVEGGIQLSVENDGTRFTPDFTGTGMGLHILRHRSASIGAQLDFHTADPTQPVTISCFLPDTTPAHANHA
jgi:PAS domain S-box-containing protein